MLRKNTLLCVLLIVCTSSLAQQSSLSKTQLTFNGWGQYSYIRNVIELPYGKVILELQDATQYEAIKHLDSIFQIVKNDIIFYADSFQNTTDNFIIKDLLNKQLDHRQLQVNRNHTDGSNYISRRGDIAKLKIEYDSIYIKYVIDSRKKTINKWGVTEYSEEEYVSIKLALNNIMDIDKVIAEKTVLKEAVDSFAAIDKSSTKKSAHKYSRSTIFTPYPKSQETKRFQKLNVFLSDNNDFSSYGRSYLDVNLNSGISLVRQDWAANADILIGLHLFKRRYAETYYTNLKLNVQPYFFFSKDASGDFHTHDNWFLSLQFGREAINHSSKPTYYKTPDIDLGIGYLYASKGGYFKNTTLKAYLNFNYRHITVSPELICTDNFNQIFPSLGMKIRISQ